MKRMTVLFAMGAVSLAAFAQPPKAGPDRNSNSKPDPKPDFASAGFVAASTSPAPSVKKEGTHVRIITPFSIFKPVVTHKVERAEGLSSRSWTETVRSNPGWSAFPRPERENPSMPLLTISFGPGH